MELNRSLFFDRPDARQTWKAAHRKGPLVIPPAQTDRLLEVLRRIQGSFTLERLAVLARVYETNEILPRLPIVCRANVRLTVSDPIDDTVTTIHSSDHVIGSLSTDHVGFASFDLRTLRESQTLMSLALAVGDEIPIDQLDAALSLELRPFGDPILAVDAFAVGDLSSRSLVVHLAMKADRFDGRAPDLSLPSLQNPGIEDWQVSPGSFAFSPERLVGSPGCEDLYPSDLSTYKFTFTRTTRLIDKAVPLRQDKRVRGVRYGLKLNFENLWYPIGHSLGQVVYSLPLAPGEKVKLAISDWRRDDSSSRSEDTAVNEQLDHDSERDRTISEVVRAAVHELQEGSSSMAGFGLSAVVPIDPVTIGASLGLGTTSTDSSGMRDLSSDMSQDLSDRVHQASSAVRQLRSTVISQTTQSDSGRFETRTVTNHNHCHALTILYYEVLRHYRVVTALQNVEPVLFVTLDPRDGPDLTDERDVLAHRRALEHALIDTRHLSGFEALLRVRAARTRFTDAADAFAAAGVGSDLSRAPLTHFYTIFTTGSDRTNSDIFLDIERTDGQSIRCIQVDPPKTNSDDDLDSVRDDFRKNSLTSFVVEPDSPVTWAEIAGFVVRHEISRDQRKQLDQNPGLEFTWDLDRLRVVGITADDDSALLLDRDVRITLDRDATPLLPVRDHASAGQAPTPPTLSDFVSAADISLAEELLLHLEAFQDHYRLAAIIHGDPVERAIAFGGLQVAGRSLGELIENRVVATAGSEVAFPLTPVGDRLMRELFDLTDEDRPVTAAIASDELVSLPTRGVFADGKLGHCSTCEVIDDTRFWDFQTSPLPDDAPAIGTLDPGSRFQQASGLSPTNLPDSLLNIVTPQDAPSPSFAAALQALVTSNLFRDMSGSTALGTFMSALAQGNSKVVSESLDSQEKSRILDQIAGMDDLSPEQKTVLMGQALGGKGGSDATAAPAEATSAAASEKKPTTGDDTADAKNGKQSSKPARPEPDPPEGTRHIRLAMNLLGVLDPSEITAAVTVAAADGPTRFFEPAVSSDGLIQVQVAADDPPTGTATLRLSWRTRRSMSDEARGLLGFLELIEGGDGNIPINTGNSVQLAGQTSFEFADGERVATMQAKPIVASRRVSATSFVSAELKASEEVGGTLAAVSTDATLTTSPLDSTDVEVEFDVLGVREIDLSQTS